MLLGFRLSLISPALYCLGILATEKLHATFLMEINASFGRRGMTERSTSHVLSFSTSVLLFRGFAMQISLPFGYWCFVKKKKSGVVLWIAFCSVLSFFLPLLFLYTAFFFFLFYLEPGCQERQKKKELKKIYREARSDPIVSMRFSLKHLRKSIWVAEEWDQTVPSHFWSCQFKVPVEHGRGEGGGCHGWGGEGDTDT